MTDTNPTHRHIYSIGELNRDVATLLSKAFPLLWIQGEISNFSRPSSGHWYFTLKDKNAQVRAAMFKMKNRSAQLKVENGIEVLVRARVTLYEPRGDYQLVVEHMEEAGAGALQRAFEELKSKLNAEGLFSTEHKKPLPAHPRQIGVITSATGAAIRDILSVLKRRSPSCPVIIYPVPVQGDNAGAQIAAMIKKAAQRNECDALILSRGGGSLEDLWAFNEEAVARAIFACEIPIVAGIGHEVDFTIADFVADQRAPTPSAAAEMLAPDQAELLNQVQRQLQRLKSGMFSQLRFHKEKLRGMEKRLVHPARRLEESAQRLDDHELRLKRGLYAMLQRKQAQLKNLDTRIHARSPVHQLEKLKTRYEFARLQLGKTMTRLLHDKSRQLASATRALDTVSPLSTMARGYSIIQDEQQKIVRDASTVSKGQKINARLAKGQLICTVEDINID